MEKWLCIGSIAVAVIMCLLFMMDLIVGIPFSNGVTFDDSPFFLVNLGGLLAAGVVAYQGWNAYRDVK